MTNKKYFNFMLVTLVLLGLTLFFRGEYKTSQQARAAGLASIEFTLPPAALVTPHQFQWNDGAVCTITGTNVSGGGYCNSLRSEVKNINTADRYVLTLSSIKINTGMSYLYLKNELATLFKKFSTTYAYSPPPATNIFMLLDTQEEPTRWGFQLAFNPVKKDTVNSYIYTNGVNIDDSTVLSNDLGCARSNSGVYLCLTTTVKVIVPEFDNDGKTLTDSMPLYHALLLDQPSLTVGGNIVGGNEISGFSISSSNAIILGGAINVVGGTQFKNYTKEGIINNLPQFSSLNKSYSNFDGEISNGSIRGSFNLNSDNNNTLDSQGNTFSTPPEGKVWKIKQNTTFNDIIFRGAGTLLVNGDVNFSGDVKCEAGTRLGIIASGNIAFSSNNIGCGAYTSLGGNIIFNSKKSGTAFGIFVAKNNIELPNLNNSEHVTIDPDAYFMKNPTNIFTTLLNILFSTTQ